EWIIFAPLVIIVLWMGVYPVSFLDIMHVSVENLVNQVETAQAAAAQAAQLAAN
ncbi:MAG: NADH-quinone oxidoreductase subunit M, partial [Thalassospira sp.]|nr:NADH-quinone oxidoreductase subunit M [Thalassospira sp.]